MAGSSLAAGPLNRSQVRRLAVFDLEHVRHTRFGQEWVPHWHAQWSFGAVVRGTCRCSVGGRPLVGRAGDLIAIAPGVVHTGMLDAYLPQTEVLVVMLYVPGPWLAHEGLAPPARSGSVPAPALAGAAQRMQTTREVQAWLREAIPVLKAGLAPQEDEAALVPSAAERTLLDKVREAVQAGEQRVDGLAHHCGVSRKRIHQVVSRWTGMAPSEYLRAVRLHVAREMLAAQEPVASVAAACGFADQAHFTRWFRRAFGYTPGDWREALAQAAP